MPVRGRTAGNRGQGSNWIRRKRRHEIYKRDGYACVYCGERNVMLTLDHLVPRSKGGGDNTSANLVTACMPCNRRRGNGEVMPLRSGLPRLPERRHIHPHDDGAQKTNGKPAA